SWSKYYSINLNFYLQTSSNNIISIIDALTSNELTTIRVSVIYIRPSENYTSKGIPRTSTFILIEDQTATCYLSAIDLSPGEEKIILLVNDQIFYQLLNIIGVTINMADTDIVFAMMSSTNLIFEYSELRKELLAVTKSN
ncbi:unnamed protein product, partial [Rotaria sp. Silwood2]